MKCRRQRVAGLFLTLVIFVTYDVALRFEGYDYFILFTFYLFIYLFERIIH